jgi:transcriptional regulator
VQALVIFLGPHAYVSPSWYPTKQNGGKVVPTWNYLTVHAYGPLRPFTDQARLRDHVTRLTARQEAAFPEPWQVSDAADEYVEAMLNGIVGLEIPIARLEGKWKMSQNRVAEDRRGAAEGLLATGRADARAVAEVMFEQQSGRGS